MKQKTVFADIDGLLVIHNGEGASRQWLLPHKLVDGAREFLDALEREGVYIVLVTARKECVREDTVQQLRWMGLIYDQLVMGLGSGPRYLLNDSKPGQPETCFALTLERNAAIDVGRVIAWMEAQCQSSSNS
jgi:hypothetical protein